MFSLETNDKKFSFFRPRSKKRAFFILYFGTFLQADFFCFIAFAFSKVKPQYSSVFAFLYIRIAQREIKLSTTTNNFIYCVLCLSFCLSL